MGDSGGKPRYCVPPNKTSPAPVARRGRREKVPRKPPSSPIMSEPDSSTDEDRSDISDLPLRTGKIGIRNPSQLCYTNATLQAFASVPEIYAQLINFEGTFSEKSKDKKDFLTKLTDLLKVLHDHISKTCTFNDRFRNEFLNQLKKYGSPSDKANFTEIDTQNDVVEFAGLLLDFIMIAQFSDEENLKKLKPKNGKVKDWVTFLFPPQKDISKNDPDALNQLTELKNFIQNKLSKTIYNKIGFFELLENEYDQTKKTLDKTEKQEGKKPEDFLGKQHFLKLNLEEFFLARIEHNGKTKNLKQRFDDHFRKKEENRNTEMNKFNYAFQKRWLFTLPDVFFVQIARYSGTGRNDNFEASYDKQPVEYDPEGTIDLLQYVYPDRKKHYENNSTYSVSAIIWYTGNHYTCISKLQDGWFKFDDGAEVEKFFFTESNLKELYMRTFCLFYRKTESPEITVIDESDDEPLPASPSPPPKPEGTLNPQRTLLRDLLEGRKTLFEKLVDDRHAQKFLEEINEALVATNDEEKELSGPNIQYGVDQLLMESIKKNEQNYDVQSYLLATDKTWNMNTFRKDGYEKLKSLWGDPEKKWGPPNQGKSNMIGGRYFDKKERMTQYFKARNQSTGLTFFYFELGGHWYMAYVKHDRNPIELHFYDSLNFFEKLPQFRVAIKTWIENFYKNKSVKEIIDTVSSSEKQKDGTSCGPFIVNKMKCEIEAYIRNLTSSFTDRAANLSNPPNPAKKRGNSSSIRETKKQKTLEAQNKEAREERKSKFNSQKFESGKPPEDTSADKVLALQLQQEADEALAQQLHKEEEKRAAVLQKAQRPRLPPQEKRSSFSRRSSQPQQISSGESSDSALSLTETSTNTKKEFLDELRRKIKDLTKGNEPVKATEIWHFAKEKFRELKKNLTIDQQKQLKNELVNFFRQELKKKKIVWISKNDERDKMNAIEKF